jgi:hypothetical protein
VHPGAYLEERILLLSLELVGTEDTQTARSLVFAQTSIVALEELEDIIDNDGLEVDLLLVVQILSLEFNLNREWSGECEFD